MATSFTPNAQMADLYGRRIVESRSLIEHYITEVINHFDNHTHATGAQSLKTAFFLVRQPDKKNDDLYSITFQHQIDRDQVCKITDCLHGMEYISCITHDFPKKEVMIFFTISHLRKKK